MGKTKINKSNLTALYKGFRIGIRPKFKLNLRCLEKCSVLTYLQHEIVKEHLDKCSYTKKVKKISQKGHEKEEVEETFINASPQHIARLVVLLDKPVKDSKVDHLGNPWERPKPISQEEIEALNQKTVDEKNRKGKSRKDLQKMDDGPAEMR